MHSVRSVSRVFSTRVFVPDSRPVGVVMLNMGGPGSLEGKEDGVEPFLSRLFADGEIIQLGGGWFQKALGWFISTRRSPRIKKQYAAIGGKSPIGDWTALQGAAMKRKLEELMPGQASAGGFKVYTAFRYAPPLTEAALVAMERDGVGRAVAFSQYPQFSCTTTGSSLNHLWRECERLGLGSTFTWSVLDRWHSHPTFLAAVARCVAIGLERFPVGATRDSTIIVFSAHSIPMMVVNKGDQYIGEVAASVAGVMGLLRGGGGGGPGSGPVGSEGPSPSSPSPAQKVVPNPYIIAWQSKVGFLPWMGPPTGEVLKGLAKQGHKNVLIVPIAFTSDHVETLYEIDLEYAEEARELGMRLERAPSLNGEDLLSTALAQLVSSHLSKGQAAETHQFAINCPGCINPSCRSILNPVVPYQKLRDAVTGGGGEKGSV